jgi:hypothetical protein
LLDSGEIRLFNYTKGENSAKKLYTLNGTKDLLSMFVDSQAQLHLLTLQGVATVNLKNEDGLSNTPI